jgi:hypothetical protein
LFASYSPNNWLAATVSLEQNAPVLRDGIVNTRFANRDDTELVFTLSTQY